MSVIFAKKCFIVKSVYNNNYLQRDTLMFFDDYEKIINGSIRSLNERVEVLSLDLVSNPVVSDGKEDVRYKAGVIYGLQVALRVIKDLRDELKGTE